MRKVRYDKKSKGTGNTETMIAVDESVEKKFGTMQHAYNEGFAASSGVRGATAESSGRITHPETKDDSHPNAEVPSIEDENAGLADN